MIYISLQLQHYNYILIKRFKMGCSYCVSIDFFYLISIVKKLHKINRKNHLRK
ncbi:MAG: hypothetical protein QG635_1531 [Bacteroidota bacterium]|nr:hypothetical protein [Bacteroidota bacterium]